METALRAEQKGAQTSTLWPKTEAELVTMNVDQFQERQNASIVCGPTALVLGKSAIRGPKTEAELAAVSSARLVRVPVFVSPGLHVPIF